MMKLLRRHRASRSWAGLPNLHPILTAGLLAGAYVLLCSLYIICAGKVTTVAASVSAFQKIEPLRGPAFVFLSGGFVFFGVLVLVRRIEAQQRELNAHQESGVALEQRATAGVLALSVAHDMRNVLTILNGTFEQIECFSVHTPSSERDAVVCGVKHAIEDLRQLTLRLLRQQQHGGSLKINELVDPSQIVEDVATLVRAHLRLAGCKLSTDACQHQRQMEGNEMLLKQMLVNLVLNACEAAGPKGEVLISTNEAARDIIFEVHDSGPGISAPEKKEIFTAFHTTKTSGTGLGLLSVKVAAEAHCGRIEVKDSWLGGACFRILIPSARLPDASLTSGRSYSVVTESSRRTAPLAKN